MRFLEKIRNLPERTRKIILWVILIVLAVIMLGWWIGRIPQKLNNFEAERFIEQLDLPDLNNIKTNVQEEIQTQEN